MILNWIVAVLTGIYLFFSIRNCIKAFYVKKRKIFFMIIAFILFDCAVLGLVYGISLFESPSFVIKQFEKL